MLKSALPAPSRRALGLATVAAVSLAGACAAWAAQPAAGPGPLIEAPAWIQRPDGADIARVYPAAAKQRGLAGAATLDCRIDAKGLLRQCAVAKETPAAAGFGQAALQLAGEFQMAPTDKTGAATSGGSVRIPIRFMPAS